MNGCHLRGFPGMSLQISFPGSHVSWLQAGLDQWELLAGHWRVKERDARASVPSHWGVFLTLQSAASFSFGGPAGNASPRNRTVGTHLLPLSLQSGDAGGPCCRQSLNSLSCPQNEIRRCCEKPDGCCVCKHTSSPLWWAWISFPPKNVVYFYEETTSFNLGKKEQ